MKSDEATAFVGTRAAMTFGGFLGGGVDVLLGRRWSLRETGARAASRRLPFPSDA